MSGMTDAGMKAAIKAQIIVVFGSPQDDDKLDKAAQAIGTAVVEYIKGNAVAVVSGVTTGGSSSGPGTVS